MQRSGLRTKTKPEFEQSKIPLKKLKERHSSSSPESNIKGESKPKTTDSGDVAGCIACGNQTIRKLDHTAEYYTKIIEFFWEIMDIEIKSQASAAQAQTHNFCDNCFVSLVELYDLNAMKESMETRFETEQKELVQISLDGIQKYEQDGNPLGKIQKQMIAEWRDKDKRMETDEFSGLPTTPTTD